MIVFAGLAKHEEGAEYGGARGAGGGEATTTPLSTIWSSPPCFLSGDCTKMVGVGLIFGMKGELEPPRCSDWDGTRGCSSREDCSMAAKEKHRFEAPPPSTLEKAFLPGPSLLALPGVDIMDYSLSLKGRMRRMKRS